jgi:hypothetical protein
MAEVRMVCGHRKQRRGGHDDEHERNWPMPMSDSPPNHEKFTWSTTMDVFAESPNRVFLVQKGELARIDKRPETKWIPGLASYAWGSWGEYPGGMWGVHGMSTDQEELVRRRDQQRPYLEVSAAARRQPGVPGRQAMERSVVGGVRGLTVFAGS